MVGVGLVLTGVSGYFAYGQYDIIHNGVKTDATVSKITEHPGSNGMMYGVELSYQVKNKTHTFIPSYRISHKTHKVDDTVTAYVSPKGVAVVGFYSLLPLGAGLLLGLIFLIGGLVWMAKHIKRYDRVMRLKRFGKKVTARFIRKETTNYKMNNQEGVILYFQAERTERIFRTQPIFSDHSIKWLEEHIFDVYISTSKPDDYYVDLEKHFGEPTKNLY